ncbi:hypothetical protein [Heyndrickxia oleronia]|uniref:hypothetical protein n=1 Tax=Heyndrickxia oleronia TaxID=38875 RepID=UPI001C0EEB5C|nr:hypothetical protein [Heyndrickxia oleronia]MBU5214392.1 hypothetical protein [Heyndrickxia oleronia]
MFYLKTKINEHIEMKIDLYDDEIFTQCPDCGVEQEVETDVIIGVLKDGGDFASTSIYCKECSKKIKGGKII